MNRHARPSRFQHELVRACSLWVVLRQSVCPKHVASRVRRCSFAAQDSLLCSNLWRRRSGRLGTGSRSTPSRTYSLVVVTEAGRKVLVRMTGAKRQRLEEAGWAVGSAADFLRRSRADEAIIEIRVALSAALRDRCRLLGLPQVALAERLGSSRSRVAKMATAEPSISLDLLVRALLTIGVTRRGLSRAVDG
jgi:hypothetical protein